MAVRAVTRQSMNSRNEKMKEDLETKSNFQSYGSCYSNLQLDKNKSEWEDALKYRKNASDCKALQAHIQEMLVLIAV